MSVIMIFLDPGDFFADAVDSVLGQSFEDLELLLVDDGSTDGSSEFAADLAERCDRVRYLEHPGHENRGTGASRALGLAHASGELFTTLDADDVWTHDAVERQVAHLDDDPSIDVVIGSTAYWWTWQPSNDRADEIRHVGPVGRRPAPASAIELLSRRGLTAPSMNAVMARMAAVHDVGGFSDDFTSLYEDQAYLFQLLLLHPVHIHRQVVDWYRQHPASTYARGLASGVDALSGPSRARAAFAQHALAFFDSVRQDRFTERGAADIEQALRAATIDASPDAVPSRHGPFDLRSQVPRVARRVRRELRHRTAESLPRLLPRRPVSTRYGYDRGTPVDRVYIEAFLDDHRTDIRGAVLEVGDPSYTRRFGGERVTTSDVVHISAGHADTTIVADLADAPQIADESFDCIIFTQTLHLIYDVDAVIATIQRILKPGGILLMTIPSLSPMTEQEGWGHYWNFTGRSAKRLVEQHFDPPDVVVDVRGNLKAALAFLIGYSAEELAPSELASLDARYPVTITVRARRGHRIVPGGAIEGAGR